MSRNDHSGSSVRFCGVGGFTLLAQRRANPNCPTTRRNRIAPREPAIDLLARAKLDFVTTPHSRLESFKSCATRSIRSAASLSETATCSAQAGDRSRRSLQPREFGVELPDAVIRLRQASSSNRCRDEPPAGPGVYHGQDPRLEALTVSRPNPDRSTCTKTNG